MAFIEAENYRFYYGEQIEPAVAIQQCQFAQGTISLLAGPSGCGKTTFLRQLAREQDLQGREEGHLVNRAKGTAYVWQDPDNQIVTDTVSYEIMFGMENKGVPVNQMRRRLAEIVTVFGLEELAERNTMELSGGEKQLLNVASSLFMNPELILLDEPASQLDPVAAVRLYDLLRRINEELGVTIVIAEQRLEDLVPLVDQMICMEEGRILAAGEPQQVFTQVRGTECETWFPATMRLSDGLLTKKEARLWFEENYRPKDRKLEKSDRREWKPEKQQDLLVIKDLYFRYEKKERDILRSCCGGFPRGEITCLAGGNGSGKTTLLRLIAGQIRPYHGRLRPASLSTAYLPQNPSYLLLEETVQAEWEAMTEKGRKLAERFLLTSLGDRHPSDLSGGEKQRLALSLVLGQEAELYLLDEPTKGMDAGAKQIFGKVLQEMTAEKKTIVIVSHDMEFAARYVNRMALLYQGQIVLQTEAREFFEENHFYTTSINRVARRVSPHIITIGDVEAYAEKTK